MPGPDHASVLSHSLLFHGMPLPDLADLVSHCKAVKFQAGQPLLEENGGVPGLYVLLEGSVQIVKRGQANLSQMGRGAFFGEISLFGLTSLGATASVVTPQGCVALLVTRDELQAWFKRHPALEVAFLRHLARELCNRLYSTTSKLVE